MHYPDDHLRVSYQTAEDTERKCRNEVDNEQQVQRSVE